MYKMMHVLAKENLEEDYCLCSKICSLGSWFSDFRPLWENLSSLCEAGRRLTHI